MKKVKTQEELLAALDAGVDKIELVGDGWFEFRGERDSWPEVHVRGNSNPDIWTWGSSKPVIVTHDSSEPDIRTYGNSNPVIRNKRAIPILAKHDHGLPYPEKGE